MESIVDKYNIEIIRVRLSNMEECKGRTCSDEELEIYIHECNSRKIRELIEYLKSGSDLWSGGMEEKLTKILENLPETMNKCVGCSCLDQYLCLTNRDFLAWKFGKSPYPWNCKKEECAAMFKYLEDIM